MKKLLLFIPVLALAIFYSACKKDSPGPQPIPLQPGNYEVYSFFQNHGAPFQTYSVKADEDTEITTAHGTKIKFWANGFKTANGSIVSGYVDIIVREIYTKKDMILSNATTTSNGELIDSKGELNIQVKQNGQELFARYQYLVQIPTTDTQGSMPLFNGQIIPMGPMFPIQGTIDWVMDTSNFYVSNYYYNGLPSSFNWINCDYFYNDPNPKDSITAVLPVTYDATNTTVFISIDGRNSVGFVHAAYPDPNKFRFRNIPIGTQVHFVTVSESDGKMYYGVMPAIVGNNTTVNIIPQEIAADQIEVQVGNLP